MPELYAEKLLEKARKKSAILGEVVISPAQMDQMTSLNPVTLEGQAEIIYNVFTYRIAKWHFNMIKADEYILVTPSAPPAFAPAMAQKERLEGQIKSGLASAAQAVADYELLKHDERKYREILDFFKEGEKDEHILRALFVDRVDAYTGEGYSMVTMAKRWPTIISDFIRMKTELDDVEKIKDELKVSKAEAVVLKTKNGLYKEWKKLFFPDVKSRYSRIKNLLDSRERSVNAYRDWLKPYVSRHRMIKEVTEIKPSAPMDNPLTFAHTPEGSVRAKLWITKPFRPEEMGKPIMLQGQGHEIEIYDDWVKGEKENIEEMYNVGIYEDEKEVKRLKKRGKKVNPYQILVRDKIKEWTYPNATATKKKELLSTHPSGLLDPRFVYYIFIDLDYDCDYKKGSTGPMVVEDQYFHFHPWLLSQNAMLLFLLELEAKKIAFDREVDQLIGTRKIEEMIQKDIEKEFENLEKKEEEAILRLESLYKFSEKTSKAGKSVISRISPLKKYFFRPGPYEHSIYERISKSFGDYFGPQVAEMVGLIKQTCYRLSGVGP